MGTNKVYPDPPAAPSSSPRESSSSLMCKVFLVLLGIISWICILVKYDKHANEYRITSVISNNATTWNISVQYLLDPYSTPIYYTSFQVLLFNNNNSYVDGNNNSLIAESVELSTPYLLMSSDPITLTNKKKIRGGFGSDQFEIGIWFKFNLVYGDNSLEDFFCANFTVVFNQNITGSGGLIASDVPKDC